MSKKSLEGEQLEQRMKALVARSHRWALFMHRWRNSCIPIPSFVKDVYYAFASKTDQALVNTATTWAKHQPHDRTDVSRADLKTQLIERAAREMILCANYDHFVDFHPMANSGRQGREATLAVARSLILIAACAWVDLQQETGEGLQEAIELAELTLLPLPC